MKTLRAWRERRASFVEMVMQGSSPFRWLEERGPACQLIAVIDKASSRLWARFTEQDTTEENLRAFGGWLRRYGRPLAHYADKNSIFRMVGAAAMGEQLRGEAARSQFGGTLSELGIEWASRCSLATHAMLIGGWGENIAWKKSWVRAARKVAQDHTVSWEGNRWGCHGR